MAPFRHQAATAAGTGGRTMRALDCKDPSHDDVHVTAGSDDELTQIVRQHITDAHPDMSPDMAADIVAQDAYDE
jgi:predicted small metal-binding protein